MREPRGSMDRYKDDACPKCGAMYCADSATFPPLPVPPEWLVRCLGCGYVAPIKEFWDAFDRRGNGQGV